MSWSLKRNHAPFDVFSNVTSFSISAPWPSHRPTLEKDQLAIDDMVGASTPMRHLNRFIAKVVPQDAAVLTHGRPIHRKTERDDL
jgi:hypothetical protein